MTQDITAVLLPAARIDCFVVDDKTAATVKTLAADWRFARVQFDVVREGIDAAISAYGQAPSPELIIIETTDIGESFIEQLGALAGVCAAGTDAVIIGPTNDVHLYRNLIGMGVKDYLVRPVKEDDLVAVMAKALVDRRGLSASRLVTVIGGKGGVGTTSISQLLAWDIAENLQQKTTLMDAAGSAGSLGIIYGVEPSTSLAEAVRTGIGGSEDDMKRIIQASTDNLSLLVCGGDPILTDSPDADQVEALVNRIMQKSPVIVMDLSGAMLSVQKRMLARSNHVVVVTTPILSSLRNCRTILGEIKHVRNNLKEVDLVINMQGIAGSEEVSAADIKDALDLEPAAVIPHAPKVFVAGETAGKGFAENKAATGFLQLLMNVATRAAGAGPGAAIAEGKKKGSSKGILKMLSQWTGR